MLQRRDFLSAVGSFPAVFVAGRTRAADKPIPDLKFNDVTELAPGVFFRYSAISATDPTVPFGGSNHTWVVFRDYVVVIDANFPKGAAETVAAIRKTTGRPIRYVLDTHHHGDHAYGNAVWAKEGAKIVAHTNAARLLKTSGPKQWADASKAPDRDDLRQSQLKQPDITFDDKFVLEDDTQRVEFLYHAHAHTAGDAVAYLPRQKVLCTGDVCNNGAFNFMGHSHTASWIQCLDQLANLDIDVICPGHGKPARKDLLATQKRYFADLRAAVKAGIDAGKSLDEITRGLNFLWYKEWTGVEVAGPDMNRQGVKHVYDELTAKIDHERLGLVPSPLDWRAGQRAAAT